MFLSLENLSKSITKEGYEIGKNSINEFINQMEEKLKNMNSEKEYTIDRFEGEFAVCEDRKTNEIINIDKSKLPSNAKEGSILKYKDCKIEVNKEKEKEVSKRIKEKMDNLWNN